MRKNGEVREESSHGLHPMNNWVDGVSGVLYGGGKVEEIVPGERNTGSTKLVFDRKSCFRQEYQGCQDRTENSTHLFVAKLIVSVVSQRI